MLSFDFTLPTAGLAVASHGGVGVSVAPAGSGTVLILSVIVLVYYLHDIFGRNGRRRFRRDGQEISSALSERDVVLTQFNAAQRDHSLLRLENLMLREFITLDSVDRMADLFLRRYAPRGESDFAAFIERVPEGTVCRWSRGLCRESLASLCLSKSELSLVSQSHSVTLQGRALRDSSVLAGLAPFDASKAKQLHLIVLGPAESPLGVLATTRLYPEGATHAQQAELARRLLECLAGRIRERRQQDERELHHQVTRDLLELRMITDRRYDHPTEMMAAFLDLLRVKLHADAAALFFYGPNGKLVLPAAARSGGSPAAEPQLPGIVSHWRTSEDTLARLASEVESPRAINAGELPRLGVNSLMRSALLVPLAGPQRRAGILCISRADSIPFGTVEESLVAPAGEFLIETLPKIADQVAIERQARQDGLTGLANRREFDLHLAAVLEKSRRTGQPVSLLMCDLDRFKNINDTHGHPAGDAVLKAAAGQLRDQVALIRADDTALIARYGGEEMAVLLPGFSTTGALRIANLIRSGIEEAGILHAGQTLRVTVSIGVSTAPMHADNAEDLLTEADRALYQAKATGRNRVCLAGQSVRVSPIVSLSRPPV